jgi:mannosyltransferase OCH1-like enzyme
MPPVFAYWADDDHSILAQLKEEWTTEFPQFQICGDDDVFPLIKQYFPNEAELYKSIRIPAAKADIARLLLLYELGGLYIDCHCGISDAVAVRRLLSSLEYKETIFIDNKDKPAPQQYKLINSIIFSRQRSELIFMVLCRAFVNLIHHRELERGNSRAPYDIWGMCGPGVINAVVLRPDHRAIRPDFEGRITIVREEIASIVRNRYRTYGGVGQHWSNRQQFEPLFEKSPAHTTVHSK